MRVYLVLKELFKADDIIQQKLNLSPEKLQKIKDGRSPVWLDIKLVKEYNTNPLYINGIQDFMFLP